MDKIKTLVYSIMLIVIIAMLAYSAWLTAIVLALAIASIVIYYLTIFLKEFKRRLHR